MHPLPRDLVHDLSTGLGLRAAVETGTYLGDTAAILSEIFPAVWSIEISQDLHERAVRQHGHRVGLHLLLGASQDVLPALVGEMGEPALFWLDGHWTADASEGPTGGRERECPVVEEIQAIDQYEHASESCILIDDARLFLGPPPPPYRAAVWPSFLELVDLLRARHDRFVTVLDDVIISGPPTIKQIVDEWWLRMTPERARTPRNGIRGAISRLKGRIKDRI